MGRAGSVLSEWGWVIIALLLLIALLRISRYRLTRQTRQDQDPLLDPESYVEQAGDAPREAGHYRDFADLLRSYVLPLRTAHPDWERLDGAHGVRGRPVAWFDWNGTRYSVNGETLFAPLLEAHAWLQANAGEDPLVVRPTKGAAGRLTLRKEIGWPDPKALRIETG